MEGITILNHVNLVKVKMIMVENLVINDNSRGAFGTSYHA